MWQIDPKITPNDLCLLVLILFSKLLSLNVVRACELLPTDRIWQRYWDATSIITLHYMADGMGYITPIIMLHYLRIHPASRIVLFYFPAGFEAASHYIVNCLLRGPCGKELRWPLNAEDSLWQTASRNLWSSQPYKCKDINSANNLSKFRSRFFFIQASRWEHSSADTFNIA